MSVASLAAEHLRITHPIHRNLGWLLLIALLLALVISGFMAAPEVALQYWYLLAAPLILSAFRFGLRGALFCSVLCVLVLLATFRTAEEAIFQLAIFVERVVSASTSPDQARDLAVQLTDLRSADPQTAFGRGLTGLGLVIFGAAMLGSSVDDRDRAHLLLERAFTQLKRYFSPQVIRTIVSQDRLDSHTRASRKEITVLFTDVRGFTALSERLEPEETAALLNEFFAAATEEIFRLDGTLDKYLGDGVMAFFGDPVWYPDHAERAFRAALGIQRRVRELQSLWESQGRAAFGVGIGISTGHAIVGNTGSPSRMEYTAIGSVVNVAARLTDLARAGEILTTRRTYWRVQQLLEGVPREATQVKGFSRPVEIVEVKGARMARRAEEAAVNERLALLIAHVVSDSGYRGMLFGSPEEAARKYHLANDELHLAQHVAVLSAYPIFQGLPALEIATLIANSVVKEYGEGTVVVSQGSVGDEFFVVLKGNVVIGAVDDQRREHHIGSLARGDYFGELSLFYDTPRTANVRASSPCTLLVLHADNFYAVMRQAPRLRSLIEGAAKGRLTQPLPSRPWDRAPASPQPAPLPLVARNGHSNGAARLTTVGAGPSAR